MKKIIKVIKKYGKSKGLSDDSIKRGCKKCIHRWRIGSWNGYFIGKQLRKISLNIWCEKCKSKHKAYIK